MSLIKNEIDSIGFLGGLILSICLTPQLYKTYKTKNTDGISYYWQSLYILGLSFTNIYTYHYKLAPIFIPGTIELFFIIILFFMKIIYSKEQNCLMRNNNINENENNYNDDEVNNINEVNNIDKVNDNNNRKLENNNIDYTNILTKNIVINDIKSIKI